MLACRERHRLRELNRVNRSPDDAADFARACIPYFGRDRQMGGVERGEIELCDYVRMPDRQRAARGHVRVAPESHVLVGRRRIPVDPGYPQIARLGREHFDGHHIRAAAARKRRDVELIPPEGAGQVVLRRDASAVHPDIRPIVDAVEIQPHILLRCRRRQVELFPVPPRRFVRTVGRHRQVRELRADGVRRSGDSPQVHAGIQIGKLILFDECTDHGSRHARLVPAGGRESGQRYRVALLRGRGRRLNRPARGERYPDLIGCGYGARGSGDCSDTQQMHEPLAHSPPPTRHCHVATPFTSTILSPATTPAVRSGSTSFSPAIIAGLSR